MSLTVVESSLDQTQLQHVIEAALLAAGRPLSENELLGLFGDVEQPKRDDLRAAIEGLQSHYEGRGLELAEVASGYRVQVRSKMAPWLSRLWEERPPRFSRALLETLCLVAYRQPITRGEIEDVRGVSVSSSIIRSLIERQWIRVVGHRDVPGKPEMFGTTREFLDYFGLKGLDDLPSLAELRDFDNPNVELEFDMVPPTSAAAAMPDDDADDEDEDGDDAVEHSVDESGDADSDADALEQTKPQPA